MGLFTLYQNQNILYQCWFDKTKCAEGLDALKNHRYKYDEVNKVYSSQPLHDWTSNGADAFMQIGIAKISHMINIKEIKRAGVKRAFGKNRKPKVLGSRTSRNRRRRR